MSENDKAIEITKKVQAFVWKHKDLMLKGKSRYEGCHALWGTCYPAAWFLHEVLLKEGIITTVVRKRFNEHGNHTYVILEEGVFKTVLDPTADQIPEGWDYTEGFVKSSSMKAEHKMPHNLTKKLLLLWEK